MQLRSNVSGIPGSLLAWVVLPLAILMTLVIATQQRQRVARRLADPQAAATNDFDTWMRMSPAFLKGEADYVTDALPTPPLTLLIFAPFTKLSRPDAQAAWVGLKLFLAAGIFVTVAAIVTRAGAPLPPSALMLVLAGWWFPLVLDMQEGQMNLLPLLPLVAGLYLAQRETAGSDLAAGVLLGLAAAIKVTPLIFIAYFVWRRRWRVSLVGGVSLALWLFVVPALAFGWSQNLRWLREWAGIMIFPYVGQARIVYATSQSVPSFALRLLSHAAAFDSHHGALTESHYINVLSLPQDSVQRLVRALTAAVGVAGLFWLRSPLPTLRCRRYVLEIGAVAAFMLWFSERTWVHHYVSFIITLFAAAMLVADPEAEATTRRHARWALLAFAALAVLASDAGRIFGPDGVDQARAFGVFLWPSVLVTAAILRPNRSAAPA
jgi:alpha-1,2-mannosyltransferase